MRGMTDDEFFSSEAFQPALGRHADLKLRFEELIRANAASRELHEVFFEVIAREVDLHFRLRRKPRWYRTRVTLGALIVAAVVLWPFITAFCMPNLLNMRPIRIGKRLRLSSAHLSRC